MDEARLLEAAALALLVTVAATPLAMRVARATGFQDEPRGYKAHARATPYLGGAAVVLGFLAAAVAFGDGLGRYAPIAAGALALWAVGTLDDRLNLPPFHRILAEIAAAGLLWSTGLGWEPFGLAPLDFALTLLWVVGVVNAFNLMDNMDGAAGTVAAVAGAGIAAVAAAGGEPALAALALALSAACAGFLPFNLSSPSRIFLGDGGSMPIGFVAAAAVMALPVDERIGAAGVLTGAMLVGLPILDTTLVSISRRRRGANLWSGARDHLTHRLRQALPSARAVALVLGGAQAAASALAAVSVELGRAPAVGVGLISLTLAGLAIAVLEFSPWASAQAEARQESSA